VHLYNIIKIKNKNNNNNNNNEKVEVIVDKSDPTRIVNYICHLLYIGVIIIGKK